jgi:DNA-binding NarL/FixJ family response regulator
MLETSDTDDVIPVRVEVSRDYRHLADDAATLAPDVVLADLGTDPGVARERLRALAVLERAAVMLAPPGLTAAEIVAAGVRAALLRSADAGAIRAALHAATLGLVVLDPALLGSLLGRPPTPPTRGASAPRTQELTARELEVLRLLAEALPNKLIADRLGISDHTAKFHVNSVLAKLSAGSRTEAVVRAARLGLVTL